MVKKRVEIPQEKVDKIMVLCKRKCCWCEKQKVTDIHHIDEDPSNNLEDNLFPCCSICHKLEIHAKIPFTRKITENELKGRRDNFYATSNFKLVILKNLNEKLKEIKPSELVKELIGKKGENKNV